MIVSPDAIILIDPPFKNIEDGDNSLAELWKSMPSLLHGSVLYTNNLPLEYRALEAVFMHIVGVLLQLFVSLLCDHVSCCKLF